MSIDVAWLIALVALVTTVVCAAWALRRAAPSTTKNEGFSSGDAVQQRSGRGCKFSADAGFVCPLQTDAIRAFGEVDPALQREVAEALQKEWGDAAGQRDAHGMLDHLEHRFQTTDALYVMADARGRLVGTVAVDRERFAPFISHLYVVPAQRGRGHARRLLRFAELYIATLSFTEARLWCEPRLVPFYARLGWEVEARQGDRTVVMVKRV